MTAADDKMTGAAFVADFVGLDGRFSACWRSFLFNILAVGVIGTGGEIAIPAGFHNQITDMTFGTSFAGI
ncbi:MAG: hypothetical protein AAB374_00230 [Patescibacteria group bacterium]